MKLNLTDDNSSYLGDGVYGHIDDYNRMWIVTYNGISVSNQICFEPEVFESAIKFYHNQERWHRENSAKAAVISFIEIKFDENGDPILDEVLNK